MGDAIATQVETKLRTLRKSRGYSLRQLEQQTGIERGLLSRYERGHGEPRYDYAVILAGALGISIQELFDLMRQRA